MVNLKYFLLGLKSVKGIDSPALALGASFIAISPEHPLVEKIISAFPKIKEKIGTNVPINTIFIARENTSKKAKIINKKIDSDDDYVTSRILWLDGLEIGKNKGSGVDSYDRYIYIRKGLG